MKTPAKKRTAAELAAAVLWCALTLGTDRLFFRYDWRTPAFFVYKALFLVLAFGLVHGAVTLVQKLRAGDKFARRWVAWTLPYLAVNLVILLIVWPGIWGNDDLAVLYLARTLQPNSWQHFLTSGAFILSLMFVPMPGGVVLVQNLSLIHIYKKAYKMLADNKRKLDEIAQYLYEKETISGEEFMRILNAQPQLPAGPSADSTNQAQ